MGRFAEHDTYRGVDAVSTRLSSIKAARLQQGLSLIELMVALAIAALLLLGLVQIFASTRVAYQTTDGLARVQENGRFAMDFLQRDVRMAGHMGCVNDQSHFLNPQQPEFFSHFLTVADRNATPPTFANAAFPVRFDIAIQGFEAGGSAPAANLNLSAMGDPPAPSSTATNWAPALPADIVAGRPIAGSDVIVLRYFSSDGAPLRIASTNAGDRIVGVPPSYANFVTRDRSAIYAITDCRKVSVFQATSAADGAGDFNVDVGGPNQSGFVGQEPYLANVSTVFRGEIVAYYVGVRAGAVAGDPASLFRMTYDNALNPVYEEIVEGVDSMQLLYGRDNNGGALPVGRVSVYETAAVVDPAGGNAARWRRVGTVRVGLLMRSIAFGGVDNVTPVVNVMGVNVNPPDDGRLRVPYSNNIALRNRLFGN